MINDPFKEISKEFLDGCKESSGCSMFYNLNKAEDILSIYCSRCERTNKYPYPLVDKTKED